MNLDDVMNELKALGTEKVRAFNTKNGVGDNQFGLKMGDIRAVAKRIKTDHDLALALWQTGNLDAMVLATLVMVPKQLSAEDLEAMVRSATFTHLADWLGSYVVKQHPEKEALRQKWMQTDEFMLARAGWSLTAERIAKLPNGLDLAGLLDRIENEMGGAPAPAQWTMNFCLAEIGINFPEHRERAVAISEKLGVFRDYPTSKGCTSPFAPI
jgi:3-methyladenine DNA glycosylase AlkD